MLLALITVLLPFTVKLPAMVTSPVVVSVVNAPVFGVEAPTVPLCGPFNAPACIAAPMVPLTCNALNVPMPVMFGWLAVFIVPYNNAPLLPMVPAAMVFAVM